MNLIPNDDDDDLRAIKQIFFRFLNVLMSLAYFEINLEDFSVVVMEPVFIAQLLT